MVRPLARLCTVPGIPATHLKNSDCYPPLIYCCMRIASTPMQTVRHSLGTNAKLCNGNTRTSQFDIRAATFHRCFCSLACCCLCGRGSRDNPDQRSGSAIHHEAAGRPDRSCRGECDIFGNGKRHQPAHISMEQKWRTDQRRNISFLHDSADNRARQPVPVCCGRQQRGGNNHEHGCDPHGQRAASDHHPAHKPTIDCGADCDVFRRRNGHQPTYLSVVQKWK